MEARKYIIRVSGVEGLQIAVETDETGLVTISTEAELSTLDLKALLPDVLISDIAKAIEVYDPDEPERSMVLKMTGQFLQMLKLAEDTVLEGQKEIQIPVTNR